TRIPWWDRQQRGRLAARGAGAGAGSSTRGRGIAAQSQGNRALRRAVPALHEGDRLGRGTQRPLPVRLGRGPQRACARAGGGARQNVDLIITFGDPAIRAAQRATQAIPIVGMSDDMVGSGLAASMARPGGNTTGVSILAPELDVKRLEILHEFVPQARRIAVLADPSTISTRAQLASAARDLG